MSHLPQLPARPPPVSTRPPPSTGPRPDHLFPVILMPALYWTFDWGRVALPVTSARTAALCTGDVRNDLASSPSSNAMRNAAAERRGLLRNARTRFNVINELSLIHISEP